MLKWLIVVGVICVAAIVFIPRKRDIPPTHEEVIEKKKEMYQMFLKDEKDTKRFYNDIRSLYPLRAYNKRGSDYNL